MAFKLKWKVIFFFMTKHIVGWLIPEIPKSIVKKCNMVLSFDSVTRIIIKSFRATIHWMKATEQYLSVVLFIMLYRAVLFFESVDKILWCDHSNESYWAVLSCGTVYYALRGGYNFWVCGWNPMVWPFKWKLQSSTFLWYCLLHWAMCF